MVNIGKKINRSKSVFFKTYDDLSPIFFLINRTIKNRTIFDITVNKPALIKCDSFISAMLLKSEIFSQRVK